MRTRTRNTHRDVATVLLGVTMIAVSVILLAGYLAVAVILDCRHPPKRYGSVYMQDMCNTLGILPVRQ